MIKINKIDIFINKIVPCKNINPTIEKKYTRMTARMKVKIMDLTFLVTDLITFWRVSS